MAFRAGVQNVGLVRLNLGLLANREAGGMDRTITVVLVSHLRRMSEEPTEGDCNAELEQ